MINKLKKLDYKKHIKRITITILKLQFYWTIAYIICLNSLGTAYCAPGWYKFFVDDKPQTVIDALSTDLSWGKVLFFFVAGVMLYKGVEYTAGVSYNFCKGIYEGYTGKDILTQEQKIDFIYNYLHDNPNALEQLPNMLQHMLEQIAGLRAVLIDIRHMEGEAFTEFSQGFADIHNMSGALDTVLLRIITLIRNGVAIDAHQNEFTALARQLNEIQTLMETSTQNMERIAGSMGNMREAINQLELTNQTEETRNMIRVLQENMGNMQQAYTQMTTLVQNPIFTTNAMVNTTANTRQTRAEEPDIQIPPQQSPHNYTRRPQRTGNRYDREIVEIQEPRNIGNLTMAPQGGNNSLNIAGMQPGQYTLNVTPQGNIHIDPIGSAIQTVTRQVSQPNSMTSNLWSGVTGFVTNPAVQDVVISYGTGIFGRMMRGQQPQQQVMPYYPPMVPYNYYPPQMPMPTTQPQGFGDLIARQAEAIGEGTGKMLGKVVGGIAKGFSPFN